MSICVQIIITLIQRQSSVHCLITLSTWKLTQMAEIIWMSHLLLHFDINCNDFAVHWFEMKSRILTFQKVLNDMTKYSHPCTWNTFPKRLELPVDLWAKYVRGHMQMQVFFLLSYWKTWWKKLFYIFLIFDKIPDAMSLVSFSIPWHYIYVWFKSLDFCVHLCINAVHIK